MASPSGENINQLFDKNGHQNSIVQNKTIMFMCLGIYVYMCICMHVCNIYMESEAVDSKESNEGYVGGFGGRKRKREIMQLLYNPEK